MSVKDKKKAKAPELRSVQWFGREDIYGFIYRSWVKNRGVPQDQFDGRPVIGICNTWSEVTPCNAHFRELAEHVRQRFPSVKVLYQTGFSDMLFENRMELEEGAAFLEKPFTARGLREAARLVLFGSINP